MTKQEAARKLARLAEEHMSSQGLSEAKKNSRVADFVAHVDAISEGRAK